MSIIVTHNGPFHADDVLAVAILRLAGINGTVTRTRNPELIGSADVVVDVGGVHDPARGRFDHHQKGGAGSRANGVSFSSAGLVWSHYGASICGIGAAVIVDEAFIQTVDALDNGQGSRTLLDKVDHMTWSDTISSLNPPWDGEQDFDGAFERAVARAVEDLEAQIRAAKGTLAAKAVLADALAKAQEGGQLLIIDRFAPIMEGIVQASETAKFLIFPQGNDWLVQCVPVAGQAFSQRLPLPVEWAGLRGSDLAALTGVGDAVFCHNGRFIGGAGSREGAIALAKLALAAG